MKTTLQLLILTGLWFSLVAFTHKPKAEVVGVYGVCESDPSNIELQLNEDYSFVYKDFSNPSNPIKVEGSWKENKKGVVLTNYQAASKFHTKWKLTNDGQSVKSRKGMLFYTLARK